MKTCAAIVGTIVGLTIVVVTALYVVPRFSAATNPRNVRSPKSSGEPSVPLVPGGRLNAPESETERMKKEIERKRIPYFKKIHDEFSDKIERASVLDDIDTLDLVVKKGDLESIQWLVQNAVGPTARDYGFERVRFYVNNPINRTEPFTIVAESSWDGSTRWNTFLK